jgi:hypothetical protein
MSTEYEPYIPRNPGDLWTADDFNDVQRQIRKDIAQQIKQAMEDITNVPNADNAQHLEDKTGDEWASDILEKARQDLPSRTGYRRYFLPLRNGRMETIEHGLGGYPLVDVYMLRRFGVVCSEDDEKYVSQVYFFLYHSSEKTLRLTQGTDTTRVTIEDADEGVYGTPFHELLALYKVPYNDRSTLDDLENEFWKAFFVKPNIAFNDDEICHSPWFDRCCGDRRTVADLKQRGDWTDIHLKVIPYKDVNSYSGAAPGPLNVTVGQLDFNTISLTYKAAAPSVGPVFNPTVSQTVARDRVGLADATDAAQPIPSPSGVFTETDKLDVRPTPVQQWSHPADDIRVMVLLKV